MPASSIAYCTYFDINYLTRGLALYESLSKFDPALDLWVLALDEETAEVLDALALPGLTVVRLGEIERWDGDVAGVKLTRSHVEYYFTLTPILPLYVFEHRQLAATVAYVDADLYFYSDPNRVLELLEGNSVLIVPHGFPKRLERLRAHGIFNVGLVGFRRGTDATKCLVRWREQCLEWCFDRVEPGRFADQAYLDDWPSTVPGTVVVDRPGVGLAPWNIMRYSIDGSVDPPTVDNDELVFYHYHGLKQLSAHVWDTGLTDYGSMPKGPRRRLYGDYVRAVGRAAEAAERVAMRRGSTLARTLRRQPGGWRYVVRRLVGRQLILTFRGHAW